MQLLQWSEGRAFCQLSASLAVSCPIDLLCTSSLPLFRATAHQLLQLASYLESQTLLSHALYIIAVLRMLLWTIGSGSSAQGLGLARLCGHSDVPLTALCLSMCSAASRSL